MGQVMILVSDIGCQAVGVDLLLHFGGYFGVLK